MAHLIERWTPGQKTPVRIAPALDIALPVGMVCGRDRRGPDEAGEWGGPCPVVVARKTLGLNSAGQLELRDRMIELRAGTTSYA